MGLSFSKHAIEQAKKAPSRIGFLYSKLEFRRFSLELVLEIFMVYISLILPYGLVVFWDSVSKPAKKKDKCNFNEVLKKMGRHTICQ